jgi:peroxiredoxin Q/BCP
VRRGSRAWGKATKERHLGDHRGRHGGARFRAPRCGREERQTVRSQGASGRRYFYPKDDTSGCTAEAKDFTCIAAEFKKAGTEVLGISPDSPASHRKFQEKHALGVHLLSDEARSAAEAYGVWVEKSMYGRKYMGVERATFLIDKAGKIARSWRNVRVPGHAEDVLEAARALKG